MITKLDFTSPLFVPGDRPDRFEKAAASGADAIILDLEDAVAPPAKISARDSLRTDFTDLPVIIRVNAVGTLWHDADIERACELNASAIMLPKSEIETVERFASAATLPVIALIETARGIAEARQIASVPSVARLAFGSIDYCADLGCAHIREALLTARSELVLASRLAQIVSPIDGVTTETDNHDLIIADAQYAAGLGFSGKLCIHPRQVESVKRGLSPDQTAIDWARRVLVSGDGAIAVGGEMVDEPVRIRARQILERAAKALPA